MCPEHVRDQVVLCRVEAGWLAARTDRSEGSLLRLRRDRRSWSRGLLGGPVAQHHALVVARLGGAHAGVVHRAGAGALRKQLAPPELNDDFSKLTYIHDTVLFNFSTRHAALQLYEDLPYSCTCTGHAGNPIPGRRPRLKALLDLEPGLTR